MNEILRVEHLKKYFIKKGIFGKKSDLVRATDDVSFTLNEGEVFVLAGESGSGKSTYTLKYLQEYKKKYKDNELYLFSALTEDETIDQMKGLKRIKIDDTETLFFFVNDNVLVNTSQTMNAIYDSHKDDDGFLYFTYCSENVFG